MEEQKLRQLFKNRSNCYVDTDDVVQGMYEECFVETVNEALRLHDVSGSAYRYPMTYDQPCQIDCRVTSCKFYKGAGKCENVSPAITLNENGKFVCWSQADR